ncbi:hypothetical protein D5R81_00455 [Parashewanella spongiae]|uniref:Uncharacterized protein n=1 Tax=Parashewanella spongiae TaxID=342950 RepID=A0A3A6U1Z6_9GAMM|nr:hypothetical protein [Parashewanella spongiae]MCL1076709.1 hypothetical protein [Parashewanella spongiae]RJY19455.1 hypothetical protein D5R81_00455 [Parashewanella spongiae]
MIKSQNEYQPLLPVNDNSLTLSGDETIHTLSTKLADYRVDLEFTSPEASWHNFYKANCGAENKPIKANLREPRSMFKRYLPSANLRHGSSLLVDILMKTTIPTEASELIQGLGEKHESKVKRLRTMQYHDSLSGKHLQYGFNYEQAKYGFSVADIHALSTAARKNDETSVKEG